MYLLAYVNLTSKSCALHVTELPNILEGPYRLDAIFPKIYLTFDRLHSLFLYNAVLSDSTQSSSISKLQASIPSCSPPRLSESFLVKPVSLLTF